MEPSRTGLTTPEQLEAMKKELAEAESPKNIARAKIAFALIILFKLMLFILFIIIVFTSFQMLALKADGKSPVIFGYSLNLVKTESMYPAFPTGSVVLTRKAEDSAYLSAGDVVIVKGRGDEQITSRILLVSKGDKNSIQYLAKGDNTDKSFTSYSFTPNMIESVIIFKIPFLRLD
jgi:signal peptidase I